MRAEPAKVAAGRRPAGQPARAGGDPAGPAGAAGRARTSGEEALKQLLVDDFAVILLDAQMPDMDGFETASHIKRRERTRHVPIIFLTAADRDAQLALRGYAAGAVDYLTKPFDPGCCGPRCRSSWSCG